MKLKKGITGFWNYHNDIPIDSIDITTIKSLISKINISGEFNVITFSDIESSNNYYRLEIVHKIKNNKFSILINARYPYYCGITSESSWMNLHFIDLDLKIKNFFDTSIEYLSKKQLEMSFTLADLHDLLQTEIDQINYWDSKTFGEIIFNGYD